MLTGGASWSRIIILKRNFAIAVLNRKSILGIYTGFFLAFISSGTRIINTFA